MGRLGALVELFITDNLLAALPAELGACSALVKLQASFNRLAALPPELGRLPRLEMLRVAVCDIAEVRRTVNFRSHACTEINSFAILRASMPHGVCSEVLLRRGPSAAGTA